LGLGLITSYDADTDVFMIESADRSALEQVTDVISDEESRYAVQLYAQLTNEFRPFVAEESVNYIVSSQKRDRAFRDIVVREYDFTCAVCEMKFRLGGLGEATAAHIVSKRQRGTDDPRNGLALCHTHHWAFDAGIFSLNDGCEVILSPVVERAEQRNFGLLELRGKPILLPDNDGVRPHPVALAWYRIYAWQGGGK
jgi:predicted restriction endonuclease